MAIYYVDRKTGKKKEELIYGDKALKWVYETRPGTLFLETLGKRKIFSSIYGKLQDLPHSRRKIKGFVKDMQIDMQEALIEELDQYQNFNSFFTRKLKSSCRPIDDHPDTLISPADGKISVWNNINTKKLLQVKGSYYDLTDLLQNKELAAEYDQGVSIIIRLCPTDYHRVHFPDDGIPGISHRIKGHYYSVNPLALTKITKLFCENKRELTLFNSESFGKMLLIEVGATCVGSIIQTYTPNQRVIKGSEKGYFKFGGSTMIMLIKKDTVQIDDDILSNTANGLETQVFMGERIGLAK